MKELVLTSKTDFQGSYVVRRRIDSDVPRSETSASVISFFFTTGGKIKES